MVDEVKASKPRIRRNVYELTEQEQKRFKALPPYIGFAFRFWREIAAVRNIDYKSIISLDIKTFTALTLDHGKHWCWPESVRCQSVALS